MAPFQLEKAYDPKAVETRWSREWLARGYFHASPERPGQPYCIVIPPTERHRIAPCRPCAEPFTPRHSDQVAAHAGV